MVIQDWSAGPVPPKIKLTQELPVRFARPLDRLAAAIIDICIVMTPLFLLISAPLKKSLTTNYILNSDPDLFLVGASMVMLAAILITAYQTLSVHWFGKTIGKRMLQLEVVPMFGATSDVTLWDSYIRSVVWVCEIFLLGLPWLAVFSNGRRRTLHDRASDTVVITRSVMGVGSPGLLEQGLVRGAFMAAFTLLAIITLVEVRTTADKMRIEHAFMAISEREVEECDIVTQNMDEEADTGDHARLKLAMSLYAAGLAERSCLEAEVEREVGTQTPVGSLTYLAQAFVYADDAEVSNSYLDKVCEDAPDSVECAMSQVVTAWSEEDWSTVEQVLRSAPKGSGYLEVWGVRHYMKQAQYANALAALDALTENRELASFSMVQRTKALYNSYRLPESQTALQQAIVALPKEETADVGAWMCAQQLQSGCAAIDSIACKQVHKGDGVNFANPPEALAQVMSLECKSSTDIDYVSLTESTKDESWQAFFRANLKKQKEDRSAASSLFARVAMSDSAPDALRVEAIRRWLEFATPRQTEDIVALWNSLDNKEAWVKVGNMVFNRLAEAKNSTLAMKVARHLMNWDSLSPKGMTQLSAMVETVPGEVRKPASSQEQKVREQVKQVLDSLEGEN